MPGSQEFNNLLLARINIGRNNNKTYSYRNTDVEKEPNRFEKSEDVSQNKNLVLFWKKRDNKRNCERINKKDVNMKQRQEAGKKTNSKKGERERESVCECVRQTEGFI